MKKTATIRPSVRRPYQGQLAYWILNRFGGVTAEVAARYRVPAREHPFPHEGLGSIGYHTPQELMKHLRTLGWKPSNFTETTDQFARVEVNPTGLKITSFTSYAAAVEASKAAAQPTVAHCPFCRQSDQLEEIGWTDERPDGSEYQGPAIKCNRCSAIAPAAAWMTL